jgi:hypothetical protein
MLLLAVAAVGVVYFTLFVRPEGRTEAPAAQSPETLKVRTVTGGVEVAGADGIYRRAPAGTLLSPNDRIRTDDEGSAELVAADGSTVKLLPATQATVAELSRELKKLRLGRGAIEADVRDDPTRVFELELGDGAAARTRGASFSATSNGEGTAAVASRRGEVVLSAQGREVVIRSGQYSRIQPGKAPDAPAPIPASLFLKVAWPSPSAKRKIIIAGETAPGARVQIQGKWQRVGKDGAYRTELDLPDGRHQVRVHAVDVGGHIVDEQSPPIIVDTQTHFEVERPTWK